MGKRWTGPRGWDVELIILDDRPVLRARQHRCLRGYCATIAELEALLATTGLSAADLAEALPTRRMIA